MLQNVHLMLAFLIDLEKKLDAFAIEGSNPNFRIFLSSDPNNDIPICLLKKSIRLTNEPPQGLKPNMRRALTSFKRKNSKTKRPRSRLFISVSATSTQSCANVESSEPRAGTDIIHSLWVISKIPPLYFKIIWTVLVPKAAVFLGMISNTSSVISCTVVTSLMTGIAASALPTSTV